MKAKLKPKCAFVVMAGDLPIGVFKDEPAAREFAHGLNDPPSSIEHTVTSVRLYEYKVGAAKESTT